jgi:hypothetical protein
MTLELRPGLAASPSGFEEFEGEEPSRYDEEPPHVPEDSEKHRGADRESEAD